MTTLAVSTERSSFLRWILLIDAATCVAMGLALALAAQIISAPLGLPAPLLQYAGVALLPIGAYIAWVATRRNPPRGGVLVVVGGNALWIAASVALLASGWVSPSPLGSAFVMAQALAVALLDVLEYVAWRNEWA